MSRENRRVIAATCGKCPGARNFTNLVVSRQGDEIVLDPHATEACPVALDAVAGLELYQLLGEWLPIGELGERPR